jgi:competence protein ComFC
MWMITAIKKIVTSIFFPSYCYLCRKEGVTLCEDCLSQRNLAYDTPSPCITPIYSFKDPAIKKIIHAIKYFHRKDLVEPFASTLSEEILKQKVETSCVLIPIPMPTLRKYSRGYNHTEAIAHCISTQTGLLMRKDILVRNSHHKRQVKTKSRSERLKNQHNAFSIQTSVEGMQCILIDDVTTTGATLLEARKLLLAHGAHSVKAYTIAH